jgi:hypothetical protein
VLLPVRNAGPYLAPALASLWRQTMRAATGIAVRPIEAARPRPEVMRALLPRTVLAFGAAPARARWRGTLLGLGLVELRDFVFIA